MDTLKKFAASFENKISADTDRGIIEGIASPFHDKPDSYGDVIARGAFAKSLENANPVAMLWSHDTSRPVGKWLELKETEAGLKVRGKLNLESSSGREAFAHVKAGDVTGLSIGYHVPDGGAYRKNGVRILKQIDLAEISLVTIPAAQTARISAVKSFESATELKDALRGIGLSKAAAEMVTRGGWPALSRQDPCKHLIKRARLLRQIAEVFQER